MRASCACGNFRIAGALLIAIGHQMSAMKGRLWGEQRFAQNLICMLNSGELQVAGFHGETKRLTESVTEGGKERG